MVSHAWLHRRHHKRGVPDLLDGFISSVVDPILDSANHHDNPDPPGPPPQPMTVTHQIFITLPATFDGPVGAMSTLNPVATPNAPAAASTTAASAATTSTDTPSSPSSVESLTSVGSSSLPSSSVPVSTSTSTSSSSGSATSSETANSPTASPAAASATPASPNAASPDAASPFSQDGSTGGLSAGSKAGIAIGIILLVGVLALLFLFCLRQRKKATGRQPLDDEKSTSAGDTSTSVAAFAEDRVPSLRSVRTASTAPRLSLRPVTQFQPNLTSNRNTGIALSPVSQLTTTSHSAEEAFSQSAVERPTSSESQNKTDPFGIHADPIDSANVAESPIIGVGPGGIIAAATSPETDVPDAEVEGAATAIGVATTIEDSTAASAGLARSASKLGHGPKPLDLTKKPSSPELPSPAVSDFSMSSDALGSSVPTPGAAAIAAAGGPPNSTVHRVQLDFSPSMDDELPLRSGQLVRLLHEYDDGWALCIRLDRSAQGVVPRTCLSMRPVKPRVHQPRVSPPPVLRPGPPPHQGHPASQVPGVGQRSASPAGGRPPMGRPSSPYNAQPGRPLAANGGQQYNPQSRPMTSTSVRPSSPASHRSQSPAQQTRRNSPPGPSPIAQDSSRSSPPGSISRKPVSGQAM